MVRVVSGMRVRESAPPDPFPEYRADPPDRFGAPPLQGAPIGEVAAGLSQADRGCTKQHDLHEDVQNRPRAQNRGTRKQSAPAAAGRTSLSGFRMSAGSSAACVDRQELGHTASQPAGRPDLEELVGPVRIGMWPEHTGDDKLRVGELLAQHAHERDRAPLAHRHRRLAEPVVGDLIESLAQPGCQRRGFPTAFTAGGKAHLGAVGRIRLEDLLEGSP